MKLWVLREALVMPSRSGSAAAGRSLLQQFVVHLLEDRLFHMFTNQEFGVPRHR